MKGAFAPKKPLSLQHWVDSVATVAMAAPVVKGVSNIVKQPVMELARTKRPITLSYSQAGKVGPPDSVHVQLVNNTSKVKSITEFGSDGYWAIRDDILGRAHYINGEHLLPHRHIAPVIDSMGRPIGRERTIAIFSPFSGN